MSSYGDKNETNKQDMMKLYSIVFYVLIITVISVCNILHDRQRLIDSFKNRRSLSQKGVKSKFQLN